MANQGAKKRKEENTRHMANLRRLIVACNVWLMLRRWVYLVIIISISKPIEYSDVDVMLMDVGYLCVAKDAHFPFYFHLEKLGCFASDIPGLLHPL